MALEVVFDVDLFNGSEDKWASHRFLKRSLVLLVATNVDFLLTHRNVPRIYQSGVRYVEEEPGPCNERWQDIPTCLRVGQADCEDLSCWRIAEIIVVERRMAVPWFGWRTRPDGGVTYHIAVRNHPDTRFPDGRHPDEDPSRIMGMR